MKCENTPINETKLSKIVRLMLK